MKTKKEVKLGFEDGKVFAINVPQSVKVVVAHAGGELEELPVNRQYDANCVVELSVVRQSLYISNLAGVRLTVEHEGRECVWE